MVVYNIDKGRQRLRTDLDHHSLTRENAKVKGRNHWCKWYGLARSMNILDLQYLAYRRKAEEHLFILQTVLVYGIVMGNLMRCQSYISFGRKLHLLTFLRQ